MTQTSLYNVTMLLTFVAIFCAVHIVFKNIRQICLWSAKLLVTGMLWTFVWVATQLHQLPQWKTDFSESIWRLVNLTRGISEL